MSYGKVNAALLEWIGREPSPERIATAINDYNWDDGCTTIEAILKKFDVDRAMILEIFVLCTGDEVIAYSSRDSIDSSSYRELWDLMVVIEKEWSRGKFRNQKFGLFPDSASFLKSKSSKYVALDQYVNLADYKGPFSFLSGLAETRTDLPTLGDVLTKADQDELNRAYSGG